VVFFLATIATTDIIDIIENFYL